jgi:quercetin dioxygenase-like cupin family protein
MTTLAAPAELLVAQAAELVPGATATPAQLADLARRLPATAADLGHLTAERAEARQNRKVVLAEHSDGAVLALAWFQPGERTDIHAHGSWAVGLVLDGSNSYERWLPSGVGAARLLQARELGAGDVFAFGGPPDDVHRQQGGENGTFELLLLGRRPPAAARVTYRPEQSLRQRITTCLLDGDRAGLVALYRADAVADINVPQWRFQLQGPAAIGAALAEEFDVPARRCRELRAVLTEDGVLVETEVSFERDGAPWMWRDLHVFRDDGDLITEHLCYCTGHWDPTTIAKQAAQAPMVRLGGLGLEAP